jgi:hypothetical protein
MVSSRKIWTWPRVLALIIITAAGSGLHFVWNAVGMYGWAQIIAPFVPVNESYWEHMKLALWPLLIWYIIEYPRTIKREGGGYKEWFAGVGAGLWAAFITMIGSYTGMKAIFGNLQDSELVIDILSFFITIFVGIRYFLKAARSDRAKRLWWLGLIGLIVMVGAAIAFTWVQPRLELFRSPDANYYGQNPTLMKPR